MEPTSRPPAPLTVVVADDTADSRMLLVRFLQHMTRARVIEVKDGVQALEVFRTESPALAFLDIEMPEMDGLATLESVRTSHPETFTVIVSGLSSLTNVEAALKLGAAGFVVKPFSARRIVDILKKFEKQCGRSILTSEEILA